MGKIIVVISLCFIIVMCLSKFEILKANDTEEPVDAVTTNSITDTYSNLHSTKYIDSDSEYVKYKEPTANISEKPTKEHEETTLVESITIEATTEKSTYCTESYMGNAKQEEHKNSYTEIYDKYSDDRDYANFYGRLHISSIGVDVALYFECSQSVVDREDGAAIFSRDRYDGLIVGDHNNQGFYKLFNVSVGTTGYIELGDGSVINIKCTWSGYGHNTVQDITDLDYNPITSGYDYLIYTCYDGWQNIGVWKWSQY